MLQNFASCFRFPSFTDYFLTIREITGQVELTQSWVQTCVNQTATGPPGGQINGGQGKQTSSLASNVGEEIDDQGNM